jgi:hypothetical protein
LTRWKIHCAAADSLPTTTFRAVFASRCIVSRETGLLHPSGSHYKDGNDALTSVGSMCSALKCDYAAVIISQLVFQASPDNIWTTLVIRLQPL